METETDNTNGGQEGGERKTTALGEVVSWVKLVVFAVLFALFINQFVIVNASVPSGSMENTIMTNDRIVAFRLSYLFAEPQRFDIVVFRFPDNEEKLYVKRIIGLPGETVLIADGRVYIDDSETPLRDGFVKAAPYGDFGPYDVPEDCYFMLGDNRGTSDDSRKWENKYVNRGKILGKVVFRYYPSFDSLSGL
jgi:signal peptidase I